MQREGVFVIRADAGPLVGSGHATRCRAIAEVAVTRGERAVFVASDSGLKEFLGRDWEVIVLPGNTRGLGASDGASLASLCSQLGAHTLLVDSYGVSGPFFSALGKSGSGCLRIAYVDDQFSFARGPLDTPDRWPVDCVINYTMYADADSYQAVYASTATQLLLGPQWTPLNPRLATACQHMPNEPLRDVLVTTGSTNPNFTLERMAEACVAAVSKLGLRDVSIHVVVGALSDYVGPRGGNVNVHQGLNDLTPLMERCQAAVSAAGTTLYELGALGVATCAVAMVDNQRKNLAGFAERDCVLDGGVLGQQVERLLGDAACREGLVRRCSGLIPCDGAARLVEALEG